MGRPHSTTIRAASGSTQKLYSAEAVRFPLSWAPPMMTISGIRSAILGSFSTAIATFVSGPVSLQDCARLRALGTAAAAAAAAFVEQRIHGYNATQPMAGASAAPVHDALAVCAVIEPALLTTRPIRVDVETTSSLAAGRTICDVRPTPDGVPNVEFAFDADGPRFVEMLVDILGR